MNKILTAFAHAAVAVVIQIALSPAIGLLGGGIAGVAFYISRELTQREYKLAIHRGWHWGKRLSSYVKPWELLYKGWSKDSALDLIAPAVSVAGIIIWSPDLPM